MAADDPKPVTVPDPKKELDGVFASLKGQEAAVARAAEIAGGSPVERTEERWTGSRSETS